MWEAGLQLGALVALEIGQSPGDSVEGMMVIFLLLLS